MSLTNFKKILLAGTAIVAVSAFSAQANAAAITSGATGAWASAGAGAGGTSATLAQAVSGDTVNLDAGATLTITNDATADDTNGVDTFVLGAVTNTAGTANIITAQGTATTTLGITIASANVGGNVSFINTNGLARQQTVDVTGALTVGGALAVTNLGATTAAMGLAATVGGALTVTGASTLTAGDVAAGTNVATLVVTGNSTFTGGMTVAGGLGSATNDATLTLNGATNTGNITLDDNGVVGDALLVFNGAAAQTVAGTVNGGVAGEGTMTVTNANGVTFAGAIGGTASLLDVTVDGTGVAKFSSTLAATTLNVTTSGTVTLTGAATTDILFGAGGTGTVNINGGLTGTVDFANVAGTVALADGKNISSTVDSTGGAVGTLNIAGTSTVTGIVGGAGATAIDAININGAAAKTATFAASVDATTVTVAGKGKSVFAGVVTGDLNFSADGYATISGAAAGLTGNIDNTTGTNGAGTVTFTDTATGVLLVGATNTLKNITINTAAAKTVTATGNFNAPTTLNLGNSNTLAIAGGGNYTGLTGQTISTVVDSVAAYGKITVAGTTALPTGTTVVISAAAGNTIAAADEITLVASTGVLTAGTITINALTPGFTWTNTSAGNDLKFTAAAAAITSNTDLTLVQIQAGIADPDLLALNNAINAANTLTAKTNLVESATPTVDGSATLSLVNVGTQVASVVDTRVAALRSGETGAAAGFATKGDNAWLQGYGSSAKQDRRGGVDGYDSNLGGVAIGYDTTGVIDGGILGVAINYGAVNADSKNANTTTTTVNSYGFNVYADAPLPNEMFLDAQAGFAYNDVQMDRHNVGAPGVTARGDTSSNQYSAKLALGRDYAMNSGVTLTPSVFASYMHLSTSGYTETGAGGLNMTVSPENFNALNLGLNAKAGWESKNYDGSLIKPEVRLGYAYDAIGDKMETSSTFTGGGAAFRTNGADPAQHSFNGGLGLTYVSTANWDMAVKYDYVYKADYASHNGSLRVTTHF